MYPKDKINTTETRLNTLSSAIFYLAILFFIIGFNFSDVMVGNWYQQFMPNIGGRLINDITFTDSLNGYVVTNEISDSSFILRTTSGGDNWFLSHFDTGICSYYSIQFINQSTGFVSGYIYDGSTFKIVKTTNGGINWYYINSAFDVVALDMHVLNQDTIWLVDGGSATGGVFRTTNGGTSWQNQLNVGSLNPGKIYMFDRNLGFVSETTGQILRRTSNSGVNWTTLPTAGAFTDMYFINSLTGWKTGAPGGPGLRKTTDGGLNWFDLPLPGGGNIFAPQIEKISVLNKDTIWGVGAQILTGSGIRGMINRSTDGGITWLFQVPDSSYNNNKYYFINFYNKQNGWAYLNFSRGIHTTTGGDPIWLTPLTQISSEVPVYYNLFNNFPNPFNPNTKIKYSVKRQTSNVKLVVFDITGKEIINLVDDAQTAGTYKVDWNAAGYSSGIYFYSLIINSSVIDTKKMVLLK